MDLEFSEIIKERTVTAVDMRLGEIESFTYVKVTKEKDRIEVEEKGGPFASLEELLEKTGVSHPIVLSLDGKGVIHREMEEIHEEGEEELIRQVLPGGDPSELSLQQYRTNHKNFLSVIRTSVLRELMKRFSDQKARVVRVVLGPYDIAATGELLFPGKAVLERGGYHLALEEGELVSMKKGEEFKGERFHMGDEWLEDFHTLPLAASIGHFLPPSGMEHVQMDLLGEGRKEQWHREVFKVAGWGVLIFFFSLLLINYFVFEHYKKEFDRKQSALVQEEGKLEEMDRLERELEYKKDLVLTAGMSTQTRLSFYADRIASKVPRSVSLTRMALAPPAEKIEQGKKVDFDHRRIVVGGRTSSNDDLNKWIRELEDFSWIEGVEVLALGQEDDDRQAEFRIRVDVQRREQ